MIHKLFVALEIKGKLCCPPVLPILEMSLSIMLSISHESTGVVVPIG